MKYVELNLHKILIIITASRIDLGDASDLHIAFNQMNKLNYNEKNWKNIMSD